MFNQLIILGTEIFFTCQIKRRKLSIFLNHQKGIYINKKRKRNKLSNELTHHLQRKTPHRQTNHNPHSINNKKRNQVISLKINKLRNLLNKLLMTLRSIKAFSHGWKNIKLNIVFLLQSILISKLRKIALIIHLFPVLSAINACHKQLI